MYILFCDKACVTQNPLLFAKYFLIPFNNEEQEPTFEPTAPVTGEHY